MVIGIVGLGLIGGSVAKTLKAKTDEKVLCCDIDKSTVKLAQIMGAADGELNNETIKSCDYIFISIYPKACIKWVEDNAPLISSKTVVIDCSGIKRDVCESCFRIAKEYSFTFIGGHPMAGYHYSGFKYARDNLYNGASMILVPENTENISLLQKTTNLLKSIGFKNVTVTDAVTHDRNIAFTSQLAHVVSNAYVKSPEAEVHKGFSAGSYKDLTRVAWLNEKMWTELFLENKDFLTFEIDNIISELKKYSDALKTNNVDELCALLKDGRERKEKIDKR